MAPRHDIETQIVERAQRDPEFRARLVSDPRTAIAEALAIEFPAELTIRVIEEQPGEAVLVLPVSVASGEVTDAELVGVAGGTTHSWCGPTCLFECDCSQATMEC